MQRKDLSLNKTSKAVVSKKSQWITCNSQIVCVCICTFNSTFIKRKLIFYKKLELGSSRDLVVRALDLLPTGPGFESNKSHW